MTPGDGLREGVPLGHSVAAHVIHGWCSHCGGPGRSVAHEVEAWRVWAHRMLLAVEEGARGGG
ncbi:hypothetical protein AB0F17_28680 [Nonomuraea sp. NPDC026600]|uniref:hypothetical protein n=1 Tax=Nonomuraea sp. NPDC026600 TaxID=3155363 RepID=UPI0033DDA9BD